MRQLPKSLTQGYGVECRQIPLAEERVRRSDHRIRGLDTVHERRNLECESALCGTAERLLLDELLVLCDLCAGEEREDLQTFDHITVIGIEPELVEGVRAREFCVDPDRVALALAELRPVAVRDQRRSDRVHGDALDAMDQVGAAGEIAPLVTAPGLQQAAVLAVELEEVQPLQDLVAELGVADAGVGVQTRAHRILLDHRADAVVLADLAQEVDG